MPNTIPPVNFRFANTAEGIPLVQVYGYIGSNESIEPQSFMSAFDAATANHSEVIVEINSGGGSVIDGFAIIDLLRTRNKHITTRVVGLAASMGFVLMLVGDRIEMMPNARLMAHRVTVGTMGDASTLDTMSKICKDYEARIIDAVVSRTGMTTDEVQKWFVSGQDTWFTADEALATKLIDAIIDTKKPMPAPPQNANATDTFNFYNRLLDNEQQNQANEMKEIINQLYLPANAAEQDVVSAIKALQDKEFALRNEMAKQKDATIDAFIHAAIAEGKIIAAQKEAFTALAKADFDNTKTLLASMPVNAQTPPQTTPPPRSLHDYIKPDGVAQPQNRANWTRDDWDKNDPKGLFNMSDSDYDAMMQRSGQTKKTASN